MKYRAIVMVPQIIEFENPGSAAHVKNQSLALMDSLQKIVIGEETFEAKLMGCYPVKPDKAGPLVFDPPPQVA